MADEEDHKHDWRPLVNLDTKKSEGVYCSDPTCDAIAVKEE